MTDATARGRLTEDGPMTGTAASRLGEQASPPAGVTPEAYWPDPIEAMTDTVRVCVVLDARRSRIHTITGDDAEAQRTVRDLAAKGHYPLAATMTVGLVTPDAASRKRIEAAMVALGWESPPDVALLHAIKAQFEAQARAAQRETAELQVRLDDHKAFTAGIMAGADSLRAELGRVRAELERIRADVTRLCDEAKHYNQHVHKGPTATDSMCVPECRTFAVWTLNPREVQAVLAAAKAGDGA